jgi:hypothetical protein
LLSLRFSGFMAEASAQAQSVMSMRYVPSFLCLLPERFSMHLVNLFLISTDRYKPFQYCNISSAIATTIGRITGRRIHTDTPNRNNTRPTPHSPRLISKIRLTPPRSECESQRDEIEPKDGPTRKLLFYFLFPPVTAEPLKYHPCTTPYQHRALQIECPALLTG